MFDMPAMEVIMLALGLKEKGSKGHEGVTK